MRYPNIRFAISFVFVFNVHAHVLQNSAVNANEPKQESKRMVIPDDIVLKHLEETKLTMYLKSLQAKSLLHPQIWSRVRYLSVTRSFSVFITSAHSPR